MRILEHLDDRSQRILGVQLDDFRGLPRVQPDVRSQREHGELLDQALQYLRRERRFFLRHQLPDRFMREETLPVRTRVEERSEEHTSELQSPCNLVCRLLLEKKKKKHYQRSDENRHTFYDKNRLSDDIY